MSKKIIHEGRNVERLREMLDIKQEAFAAELGETGAREKYHYWKPKKLLSRQYWNRS